MDIPSLIPLIPSLNLHGSVLEEVGVELERVLEWDDGDQQAVITA